jgi:hypothetical protein
MGVFWEVEDWAWGLGLIVLTTAVHTLGVVMLGLAAVRMKNRLERRATSAPRAIMILTGVIGAAGLLLAILHGTEYAIWAVAYLRIGALDTPWQAMLYSIDSMTTRGASGLSLTPHWRMMGALEAADGMILFGLSTAFLFALVQSFWSLFMIRRS